ncbi:MAG: L-ribulose-5-phosphate 3-epimerase [Clostridia bacterium]|nr:L-ribulose-5-phosphate 3-epimerase [Clostridia bacterium]
MGYKLGIYEKAMPGELSWKEKLKCAKDAGFDFVEISIDESDSKLERLESAEKYSRELFKASEYAGLSVGSMCLSGHRRFPLGSSNPEIEKRSLDIMEKAIVFASECGIRIIQLAGYDVYYDEKSSPETRERFIKNLRKSSLMASEYGVMLALETMENDFCNTASKALEFVKAVDSPWLKIYPDIGNIYNGTDDPQGDIKACAGNIVAAHLKETKPGVFRDLFYGEGRVDFGESVKTLFSIGVRRFNAEFWYKGEKDWDERLSKASRFLRKYLDTEDDRI